MLGLPGESLKLFLESVHRVIDLAPNFIRIYPLLVLAGSPLEKLYRQNLFSPISLEEAVQWAKRAMISLDRAQIPVIRMGIQSTPGLEQPGTILAGPFHPAFRSLVDSSLFFDMACLVLEAHENRECHEVRFRVSPGDVASFNGERKGNLARLRTVYGLEAIEVIQDPGIPRGTLLLENPAGPLSFSRRELFSALKYDCQNDVSILPS